MKAIARTVLSAAATLMIAALPVLAEESMMGQQEESVNSRECLLVAKNCPTESLQSREQRIQSEISRGTDVYTKDELRKLQNELDEVQKEIETNFEFGGA